MPLSPINSKPNDETLAGKIFAEIRGLNGPDRRSGPLLRQFSAAQARQLKDYIHANLDCTLN